jgi:hypothetical protein
MLDTFRIAGILLICIGLVAAIALTKFVTWTFDKEEGFRLIESTGLTGQDVIKYRLDEIVDLSVERGFGDSGGVGDSIVDTRPEERLLLELKAGYRVPLHPFFEPIGKDAGILVDRIRTFLSKGGIR